MSNDNIYDDDALEYRSIYTGAILAMLLGLLSASILFNASGSLQYTLLLAPIPIVGFFISLSALKTIREAPEVFTGKKLAMAGLLMSVSFLLIGIGSSTFIYLTEVPDGYIRTSFLDMKPDEADILSRNLVPEDIEELLKLKQKVFIKGFIRPDSITYTENINNFLLVRDNNQCCFGDPSAVKFFDQVRVQLEPGMTTDYHAGLFRIGGTLSIGPGNSEYGTPLTYKIAADYVKD